MSYVAKSRSSLRRIRNRNMAMGSNQSMPQTHRVASRVLDGVGGIPEYPTTATSNPTLGRRRALGASAMEYATKPVIVPVPPTKLVRSYRPARPVTLLGGGSSYNAFTGGLGLGSLGDDTGAPATPTIGMDPVMLQQQQLAELQKISAAQVAFTKRESQERLMQIGATLLIPLSAAIWRAIFRSGRSSTKDFE